MEIWVETDLEPDDLLALRMKPLRSANYYVVGENMNPNIKYNRMREYARLLGNSHAKIIEGRKSKTPFPNEGAEFPSLPKHVCTEIYLPNFIKFAQSKSPIFFSLKPARELMFEFKKDPSAMRKLLTNVDGYFYGGFNFRSLLAEGLTEGNLVDLLKCFKKVVIYEGHYVSGDNNTINRNNFPLLAQFLVGVSNEEYIGTFLRLIKVWNTHIKERCLKNLEKCSLEQKKRNQKILDNLSGHEDFQLLLADFALIAIHDVIPPIPVKNISFDSNKYTLFDFDLDTNETTNLFMYQNIPNEIIEKLVVSKLV